MQKIFDDDPPQLYFFENYLENHELYVTKQTILWQNLVSIALATKASAYTIIKKDEENNNNKIEGAGVYIAYNSKNMPSVFQFIKGGFWKAIFQWQFSVFKRVVDFGNLTEAAHHRIVCLKLFFNSIYSRNILIIIFIINRCKIKSTFIY